MISAGFLGKPDFPLTGTSRTSDLHPFKPYAIVF